MLYNLGSLYQFKAKQMDRLLSNNKDTVDFPLEVKNLAKFVLKTIESVKNGENSMKFDHEKAKNLYKTTDPDEDFLSLIVDKIHKAPGCYTLKGLMIEMGHTFVHCEVQEAINILEAIYEALDKEKDFIIENKLDFDDKDVLFNEALASMRQGAEENERTELLNELSRLYA